MKKLIAIFLFLAVCILPFNASGDIVKIQGAIEPAPNPVSDSIDSVLSSISSLNDAIAVIKKYQLEGDKITAARIERAVQEAIKVILKEMCPEDRYSYYFSKEEMSEMAQARVAKKGIGITFEYSREGTAIIRYIFPDSPAEKAGLERNDEILNIDGQAVKNNFSELVGAALKAAKTETNLSVKRGEKTFPVKVEFGNIERPVFKKEIIGEIGYLAIYTFQGNENKFASDFYEAIEWLNSKDVKALILDVRYNSGGLVNNALLVCDALAPQTMEPLIITRLQSRREKEEYASLPGLRRAVFTGPIIVLVNRGSASASEIVAGALQDWGRAKVMGSKTLGKGCGQIFIPFSDGSALLLTNFYYYLPSGRSIHRIGVIPDIVDDDKTDFKDMGDIRTDSLLKKAKEMLENQLQPRIN